MMHPARTPKLEEPQEQPVPRPLIRPHVIVAGPEAFTIDEMRTVRHALEDRKARVSTFRMTDEFRMSEVADEMETCTWLLLGVDEYPGRELEILRCAERAKIPTPKVGLICLKHRVDVSSRMHVGGKLDLVVKRVPGDMSFNNSSRTNHSMVLAPDLTSETDAARIARAVIPALFE